MTVNFVGGSYHRFRVPTSVWRQIEGSWEGASRARVNSGDMEVCFAWDKVTHIVEKPVTEE